MAGTGRICLSWSSGRYAVCVPRRRPTTTAATGSSPQTTRGPALLVSVHQRPRPEADHGSVLSGLDAGSPQLVTPYAEALGIHAGIQLAVELTRRDNHCSADDAYLGLCIQAGAAGTDLGGAATTAIGRR